MNTPFFFGPDKLPFTLTENGMVEESPVMPFHGIISRGLLSKIKSGEMDDRIWYRYAHRVESNTIEDDDDLVEFNSLIKKCGVLSFGQSARIVQKYLTEHHSKNAINRNSVLEIWNIKEGHTSSVWKIVMNNRTEKETFILNVARDYEASKELEETSVRLQKIGNAIPDINLARILDIASIKGDSLSFNVTVTKNEWINNSFEIHNRKDPATGRDEFILIDRFLTDADNHAKVTSILGRRFSEIETKKIHEDIKHFLNNAATCLNEKPSLEINEGDIVWDGEKAVVVAIT